MSGHSKWATTKRQKFATDSKRAAVFTRLANAIVIAAKEKGGDLDANFTLRLAVDKAKAANMPKDNIDRAIKRGTGEIAGAIIEQLTYEGYGPAGVAVLIETLTDNRNRTVSEVKHVLTKYGGNLGTAGSVSWMFERKGQIGILKNNFSPDLELELIEQGVADIITNEDEVSIITEPEYLQKIKEFLESKKIDIEFASLDYIAKDKVTIDDPDTSTKLDKMFDELNDLEDVKDYYSNLA